MSLSGLLIFLLLPLAVPQGHVYTDVKKNLSIYYDMDWTAVPMLPRPAGGSGLKENRLGFGPLPCSCQDSTCGCCVNVDISFFDFSRTGCMNFTYVPNDLAIQMNLLMNDESVYSNTISGKNPPPACVPVPYLAGAVMCFKFFDLYTEGNNIHMCVNLETTIVRQPILVLQFDCFLMGSDGLSHSKPTESSAAVGEAMKQGNSAG